MVLCLICAGSPWGLWFCPGALWLLARVVVSGGFDGCQWLLLSSEVAPGVGLGWAWLGFGCLWLVHSGPGMERGLGGWLDGLRRFLACYLCL